MHMLHINVYMPLHILCVYVYTCIYICDNIYIWCNIPEIKLIYKLLCCLWCNMYNTYIYIHTYIVYRLIDHILSIYNVHHRRNRCGPASPPEGWPLSCHADLGKSDATEVVLRIHIPSAVPRCPADWWRDTKARQKDQALHHTGIQTSRNFFPRLDQVLHVLLASRTTHHPSKMEPFHS